MATTSQLSDEELADILAEAQELVTAERQTVVLAARLYKEAIDMRNDIQAEADRREHQRNHNIDIVDSMLYAAMYASGLKARDYTQNKRFIFNNPFA